jgi:hypothetical protein
MNEAEAKRRIIEGINVTRQRVTIAKAFVLKNFDPNAATLIESFMKSVEAKMPQQLVLHQSIDPIPTLKEYSEAISWKLAACEAIWGLISNGAVFPASTDLFGDIGPVQWTTVIPGSGGHSSGFQLDGLSIRVPRALALPKSADGYTSQPLTDPDLYLKELDLPGFLSEIEVALREAVRCFRHELYLACLAMLARASEAAWIETGLALGKHISPADKAEKFAEEIQSPFIGIGKKIQSVLDLYSKAEFADLAKASGVRLQDLKNSVVWADCVRDSRNSIHYGAEPAMTNSYEKVAAILIGAVPHIRLLAAIGRAANETARS